MVNAAKSAPKKGKARRDWKPAFLAALELDGVVVSAARAAGIDRQTAYNLYGKDPVFAKAWDDALESAVDDLETEARKRAKDGSDVLLIFLLKANRPAKYRETRPDTNIVINDDRSTIPAAVAERMLRAADEPEPKPKLRIDG